MSSPHLHCDGWVRVDVSLAVIASAMRGCFPAAVTVRSSRGLEVDVGRVRRVHSEWHRCSKASCAADLQRLTSASRQLLSFLA